MAKMYYNLEEAAARLGCNEEQLRGLVRAGKLREFRDAGKLNYRVDEVEKLAAETGDNAASSSSSGELKLADESSDMPALSQSDSGSGLGLEEADAPIDLGGSDSGLPALKSGSGSTTGLTLADTDTATPPKPRESSKSGSGSGADILRLDEADRELGNRKDDTVITNIGISVFDDDDLEIAADPRAKTMMTGADEHLGLDGSGGGSGLLDLTRESDDTSLGAELLEGIDMGDTAETLAPTQTADAVEPVGPAVGDEMPEPALEPVLPLGPRTVTVHYVEAASPAFTGLLVAAAIALTLLGATVIANSMGTWPSYLAMLADNFWLSLGGMIGLGALGAGVGFLVG
ncbi:MAG: helix-turn-helix domain-containing protein, partial [Phycisphaerae bacterium]